MAKNIVSVGFLFPGNLVEYVQLTTRKSLLDADLVVFRPSLRPFHYSDEDHQGKPLLRERSSFEAREAAHYWRQQVQIASEAGKNVVIFLPPITEVFIDTGKRSYSGTGRNRQVTKHVDLLGNYDFLTSFYEKVIPSEGEKMRLTEVGNVILADFWNEFGEASKYNVVFQGLKVRPLVTTASGGHPVGCIFRFGQSQGEIVCLPALREYDLGDGYAGDNIEWDSADVKFGKRLLGALSRLDDTVRSESPVTPPPEWAGEDQYLLTSERALSQKILTVDLEIEARLKERQDLADALRVESSLRRLLFAKGHELEAAIVDALRELGFSAEQFRDGESEFDAVFTSAEGRFLGEAEGKDRKAINVDKLRQLEMNIQEDFARDDVADYARGVLFGNAFRLEPPGGRPDEYFTQKCLTAAARSGTSLVRTTDLFFAAKAAKETKDSSFMAKCRKAIFDHAGKVVVFPAPKKVPGKRKKTIAVD